MLSYLHVKNFALINELELDFNEGLTVLTGETGAGKSIIIGSMNAIAGGKLDKGIIRTGSDFALIEMIFETDRPFIDYLQSHYELPFDEESTLIVSRRFNITGRSVYRVNGETVTLTIVKEIAHHMIDIHSQHDHQSLLKQPQHIILLDRYIGSDIGVLKAELRRLYDLYRAHMKQIKEDALDDDQRRREMDFLRFEIEEINLAELQAGEDVELHNEYKILSNSQKIVKSLSEVSFFLEENPEGNALEMMGAIVSNINAVKQYDDNLLEMATEAQQIEGLLYEFHRHVEHYVSEIEMDHQNIELIEARLHTINTLKSKYGEDLQDIINLSDTKSNELEYLEHYAENVEGIKKEIELYKKQILDLCGDISAMRQAAAKHISNEIHQVLTELNFVDCVVEVEVVQRDEFDASGFDRVTILISTNKNEPVQPLNHIASGGELSRVMLALKSVFAEMDQVGTLVFDEIDTGISGRTAQKVAEKMAALASNRQIICITHLPQIAAMADDHYQIVKTEIDDRIESTVNILEMKEVHQELARLIGGARITENTLESAKEMKELAMELKASTR